MKFIVNNKPVDLDIEPGELLVDVLRDKLGLLGVRESCGRGECGACTVLINGKPVASCIILAKQAEGKEIITIEGLMKNGELHPIQEAFIEEHGMQCGFCTPGLILTAKSLLDENKNPSIEQVRAAIGGHICRCGGYPAIIKSIMKASELLKEEDYAE